MKLVISPFHHACTHEIATFTYNQRKFVRDEKELFELKAMNLPTGSLFIDQTIVQDGRVWISIRMDPIFLLADFVNRYSHVVELGLPEYHEDVKRMNMDWLELAPCLANISQKNFSVSITEGPVSLIQSQPTELIVNYLVVKYFDDFKLKVLESCSLYKTLSNSKPFMTKWDISSARCAQFIRAISAELLQENLPLPIFEKLCEKLELKPINWDMPIYKSKPSEASEASSSVKAQQMTNLKKRGVKGPSALEQDAKSSKKLTSFFKPK